MFGFFNDNSYDARANAFCGTYVGGVGAGVLQFILNWLSFVTTIKLH